MGAVRRHHVPGPSGSSRCGALPTSSRTCASSVRCASHRWSPTHRTADPAVQISQRRRVERSRYRTLGRLDRSADLEHEAADEIASAVAAQAVRAPLMAALARLATRDREVLLLAAWANLSYQEIADALHIPIGTVGSRLNRARRRVRAAVPGLDITAHGEERQ